MANGLKERGDTASRRVLIVGYKDCILSSVRLPSKGLISMKGNFL